MASENSAQEKTEDPTPKRMEKAFEDGQVLSVGFRPGGLRRLRPEQAADGVLGADIEVRRVGAQQPGPEADEQRQPRRDAVPAEGAQAVARQETHEPAHGERRGQRRHAEADRDGRPRARRLAGVVR